MRTHYKVGQIADTDIIAPFSFTVYKSAETIEKEKERIAANVEPVYKVSESIKFNTLSRIDSFIEHLAVISRETDVNNIQSLLRDRGFNLTLENIELLIPNEHRLQLHNYLINILNSTMSVGIYDDSFLGDPIKLAVNGAYREVSPDRLFSIEESRQRIINNANQDYLKPILEQITPYFLTANIVIDTEKTNVLFQEAYTVIDPTLTEVLENEEIIRKNRRITEMDLKKLEAMYDRSDLNGATVNGLRATVLAVVGYLLLSFLLLLSGYFAFGAVIKDQFYQLGHTVTYLILVILLMSMTYGITKLDNVPYIILPFALSIVLFAILFTPVSAIILNCICLMLVLPFLNWSVVEISTLFLATMLLLIIMTRMKDTHDFLALSVTCLISFLTAAIIISLLTRNDDFVNFLFFGSLSSIISVTGVILISPIIEKNLNLTNKMILLQLQDTNNPLLKRMSTDAPGTYNHSLMVGNLAESAAAAIGANALLAKVGGLYHDIGKLEEPDIFVENNSNAPEIYEKMDSYESTVNIRNHVLSGLTLAKKYKLPQQVTDIIRQHHGVSKVSFFYEKAKKSDPNVDEDKFRYYGPKPETKEATLVMIADIVESTVKSMKSLHNEESFKKIINDTITRIINDGQLSEAPITLKELEKVKTFMLPIVVGIYQKRIEYPKESTDDNRNPDQPESSQ